MPAAIIAGNSIMPTVDNEELTDAPSIVPDRDELASYQRQKQSKPKPRPKEHEEPVRGGDSGGRRASGSNALTYAVGLVAVLGVGAAGYLFTQLQSALERVAALEQRLSSTDASVNQSSGALQVKINDVGDAVAKLRDETQDAQKKYKAQLDKLDGQITALEKADKSARASIAANDRAIDTQTKAVDALRGDVANVPTLIAPVQQKVDQQQSALDALSARLKSTNETQAKLGARMTNTEEWIDSINTFRKQMNREVVNIKQQIAGGKPATPPPLQ